MKQGPQIQVSLQAIDWLLEIIGLIAIFFLFFYTFSYYDSLPAEIPRHFGFNGQPDAYSSKIIIWTFPILGLLLYGFLRLINSFPHTFNYAKEITEENALEQYRLMTRVLRIINVLTALLFCSLLYNLVQVGLGYREELILSLDIVLYVVVVLGLSFYSFYRSKRL